jgi:hypothetical protein
MNKRNIIIFGSILLVLAIVGIFYFISAKKVQNQAKQTNQPAVTSNVTLPAETSVNPQNVQSVQKIIENTTQEPISSQTTQEGSKLVNFKDQNGKPIPLADFEKATGVAINQQLRGYLDNKDYRIFYCLEGNSGKDLGVYFGYNVQKAYANLYPDTLAWMKDWEKTMLRDLHAVLFPDVNFSEGDLNQQVQFKDGKYRYAEIRLPDGKKSSINYHVSDNGVIIAASPACLEKLISIYEPVEP